MGDARQHHLGQSKGPLPEPLGHVLHLLERAGLAPDQLDFGKWVLERELARIARLKELDAPKIVVLFSGHMVDQPGRSPPRFPESKVDAAAASIVHALDELATAKGDLGLAQAACGGDLLFAQACRHRGMRFEARLPQPEPDFLANSVLFAGARWESLYRDVRADPSARLLVMRDELASIPEGMNDYEATNLWMLCAALAHGPEKLRFLCLWDGEGGEGPGGTKHMFDLAHKISGKPAIQIKPQELR